MLPNTGFISRICTFILADGKGKRLDPLTRARAKPLVHFGGVFRIIDFTLSNCVNSGLKNASLLTRRKDASLEKYIELTGTSPNGPFSPAQGGSLRCLSPKQGGTCRGSADMIFQNLPILQQERPDVVLLLKADHIYKMDYRKLLRFHAESRADITVAAMDSPRNRTNRSRILQVNSRNDVIRPGENLEHPDVPERGSCRTLASMGIYVFNTAALIKAVVEDRCRINSSHDFARDIIPNSIDSLRVCAYNFSAAAKSMRYWRDIGSIDRYYHSQMELLMVNSPFDPYNDALWPTYAFGGHDHVNSPLTELDMNSALDSAVSRQASLSGACVVQSVISAGVHVGASSEIRSSILLPGVRVGRGARIRKAIIDENAEIPEGSEIGHDPDADRRRFRVTRDGVVIVPANPALTRESYRYPAAGRFLAAH